MPHLPISKIPADSGCYLICASKRIGGTGKNGAQHYFGFARNIRRRVRQHRDANGSAITIAFIRAGAKLRVSRVWVGVNQQFERRHKNGGKLYLLCPHCNPGTQRAYVVQPGESLDGLPFHADLRIHRI